MSKRIRRQQRILRKILTSPEDASIIEILDRVLDHGIVVEPYTRLRLHSLRLGRRFNHLVLYSLDSSS